VIGIEAGAIASDCAQSLTACGHTVAIISARSPEVTLRSPVQLRRAQQVCMDALRLAKAVVARSAVPHTRIADQRQRAELLPCHQNSQLT
jgi:hypothetical protein